MAKIDGVQEVVISDLIPYAKNAKKHSADQVEKIADSIKEFGFLSPVLIDDNKNIIAGHGRVMAAEVLGLEKVPCVNIKGLTQEQYRAYVLADNKLTELGEWDMDLVNLELTELAELDFNISLTGFDLNTTDWFDTRERYDNGGEYSEEYNEFLEKFEDKHTTDDCYTPDEVYEAVKGWCVDRYNIKEKDVVRPFYPGGDYQKEIYKKGAVVIDNPPFSILSEITRFYDEKGVKFFLFGPGVTIINCAKDKATIIATNATIEYENGATVNTSFVTNMEGDVAMMTSPSLHDAIYEANKIARQKHKTYQPKYSYPPEVITTAMCGKYSKWGVELVIPRNKCKCIDELDSQKEKGKAIYGKGFLISSKIAAEKIAAEKIAAEKIAAEKARQIREEEHDEVWELSEREKAIIKELDGE